MSVWQAVILSIVQGLTEFLPVSSSGHLALAAKFLGLPSPGLAFSIWVHIGTAMATIVMLRKEIAWLVKGVFVPALKEDRRRPLAIAGYIIAASVPAAVIGLLFEDKIEASFSSAIVASIGLIITGCFLQFSRPTAANGFQGRNTLQRSKAGEFTLGTVTFPRSVAVGISQAIAIVPGISRSGATIISGLLSGMSREDAARFSFLLSLPAVFGAALLDARSALVAHVSPISTNSVLGAGISFVIGLFALRFLLKIVRQGELSKFSYYCWAAGAVSLVLSLLRP